MSDNPITPVLGNGAANGAHMDHGDPGERPVGREEVMVAVLAAATELFARSGPTGVSVREIAERAGVNHALIHRHFGTKDELLRLVLAQAMARVSAIARSATNTREDLALVLSATRREATTLRLLAWAILSGYPLDRIWPDHPTISRFTDLLEEERSAGDKGAPAHVTEDPRVAMASAVALVFGWTLFEPFLDRAADLHNVPGFQPEAVLNRLSQVLLDVAR